eukprot:s851_g21.t1
MLQQKAYEQFWVSTRRQIADGLTKRKREELWESYCEHHSLSLKETPQEKALEEQRQRVRRDQRQRRKTRFKKSTKGSTSNSSYAS